jgi:hypothetical protein
LGHLLDPAVVHLVVKIVYLENTMIMQMVHHHAKIVLQELLVLMKKQLQQRDALVVIVANGHLLVPISAQIVLLVTI